MTASIHDEQEDRPIPWEFDPTALLDYSVSLPGLVTSDDQEDHEGEDT